MGSGRELRCAALTYSRGASAGGLQAHDPGEKTLSAHSAFRTREASDQLIRTPLDIACRLRRAMRRVYGALPRAAGSELLSGHIIESLRLDDTRDVFRRRRAGERFDRERSMGYRLPERRSLSDGLQQGDEL